MKIIPMTEIFCDIDDFYREFKDNLPKNLLPSSEEADFPLTMPPCILSPSEMMTLVVIFHLLIIEHLNIFISMSDNIGVRNFLT